jgi:hypothetical protein
VAPLRLTQLTRVFLGEFIWGRGSSDDKSGLIGILYVSVISPLQRCQTLTSQNSASIETLLEKGFKPARTVVLAFGFDEEASGVHVSGSVSLKPSMWPKSFAVRVPDISPPQCWRYMAKIRLLYL